MEHLPHGAVVFVVTFPACTEPLVAYDREAALDAARAVLKAGHDVTIEVGLVDRQEVPA